MLQIKRSSRRRGGGAANQQLVIDHCTLVSNPSIDKIEIRLVYGANAVIRDTVMDGYLKYAGTGGAVSLERVSTRNRVLFEVQRPCHLRVRDCLRLTEDFLPDVYFPDIAA